MISYNVNMTNTANFTLICISIKHIRYLQSHMLSIFLSAYEMKDDWFQMHICLWHSNSIVIQYFVRLISQIRWALWVFWTLLLSLLLIQYNNHALNGFYCWLVCTHGSEHTAIRNIRDDSKLFEPQRSSDSGGGLKFFMFTLKREQKLQQEVIPKLMCNLLNSQ